MWNDGIDDVYCPALVWLRGDAAVVVAALVVLHPTVTSPTMMMTLAMFDVCYFPHFPYSICYFARRNLFAPIDCNCLLLPLSLLSYFHHWLSLLKFSPLY